MKLVVMIGLLMVVVGIVALSIPTFTYFTTERVANAGFFKIDISRPHALVINPAVGGIVLALGIVLILVGRRAATT